MVRNGLATVSILFLLLLPMLFISTEVSCDEMETDGINGFFQKAAQSLVHKTMGVAIASRLDSEMKSVRSTSSTSEYPIGDRIGEILKAIGLVLIITMVVGFIITPITVFLVLCCCGYAGNYYVHIIKKMSFVTAIEFTVLGARTGPYRRPQEKHRGSSKKISAPLPASFPIGRYIKVGGDVESESCTSRLERSGFFERIFFLFLIGLCCGLPLGVIACVNAWQYL